MPINLNESHFPASDIVFKRVVRTGVSQDVRLIL